MNISRSEKIKKSILFLGDWLGFYSALFLTLFLRFRDDFSNEWFRHALYFFQVFVLWSLVFYNGHFYEIKEACPRKGWSWKIAAKLQTINFFAAMIFFYIFPSITPKTNLLLTAIFSLVVSVFWRKIFSLIFKAGLTKILIIGGGEEAGELKRFLDDSPQLGYQVVELISGFSKDWSDSFSEKIKELKIGGIVVSRLANRSDGKSALFESFFTKVNFWDFAIFYENLIKKVPLSEIDENWFLVYLSGVEKRFFNFFKRIFDLIFAVFCLIASFPLWLLAIILVKSGSKGPIFYFHKRIGKNGKIFTIIKFRTMIVGADKIGSHWTEKNDKRITRFGRFLRKTHIDEIPQFINIIKGEMSFVGPRPEEEELVKLFSEKIPFYRTRHLIKPGLIGWAQYNYPHGASVDDAIKKFQYDLYYLKHRSFWLDLGIIVRTLRIFIIQPTH